MDEVIFEEFKGTGNMELRLDRRLAERRIYPSIDVEASSTRHEELLFDRQQLQQVWKLRRVLNALEDGKGLELLIDKIRTTKSNDEFLAEIAKAPTPGRRLTPSGPRNQSFGRTWRVSVNPRAPSSVDWTHHEDRHPPRLRRVHGALLVRQRVHDPLDRARACASSSAPSATPSTRASRSWSTPVAGSSASSAGTRSPRPRRSKA